MQKSLSATWAAALALLLNACGDGGGSNPTPIVAVTPPPVLQSPGGIWSGPAASGETITLYITESGEFRSVTGIFGMWIQPVDATSNL